MEADFVYGENTEMYLKTLAELAVGKDVVPVTDLAERLGISTVSASEKVHRLQDQGFVEHLPYKGVSLTDAGRRRANIVLRQHRLWERFLVDHLDVDWQDAHEVACRLEHATTMDLCERLATYLEEPTTCPHGNPIQDAEALPAPEQGQTLTHFDEAGEVVVTRIFPENTSLLSEIASLGLTPGASCQVFSTPVEGGPLELVIAGQPVTVSDEIGRHLYVRSADEAAQ